MLFNYDAYDNFKMKNASGKTALDIIKEDEALKKKVIELLTTDDGPGSERHSEEQKNVRVVQWANLITQP